MSIALSQDRPSPSTAPDAAAAVPHRGAAATNAAPPVTDAGPPAPVAALALFGKFLSARSLPAAAHALVGALTAEYGVTRASLGVHEDGHMRLLAASHLSLASPGPAPVQHLLGAMEEALEQCVSLAWPPAMGAPDHIRVEHEALQRLNGGAVATVPLGVAGEPFGALCVERSAATPFEVAELARLEQLMMLAVPALRWMQYAEQSWARRLRRDMLRACARLRQPDHVLARRLGIAAAIVLACLAVLPLQREVGGRARIEGAEQRVLVAPADGFVKLAHVRPGDRVKAGDVLVDLIDSDLRLERERWASQLAQHENAYVAAMAKSDRATASTSLARISEAQSQLALVDEQLARGRVEAPFDALVIQGDLSQSIGMPVRQGDVLLTLATTGRHRVIVEVDEVDIARVQPGQGGQLALSSLPWDRQDLAVERIVPLAKAVDGRNVFEVEARLAAGTAELRPGLLGRAEIAVGRMPPLWAWLGHALDRARVAWWAWLG